MWFHTQLELKILNGIKHRSTTNDNLIRKTFGDIAGEQYDLMKRTVALPRGENITEAVSASKSNFESNSGTTRKLHQKSKTKEQSLATLHIHLGQETRNPHPLDLWNEVRKQLIVTLENEEIEKEFHFDWAENRGVVTCTNDEETVEMFINMIKLIKIKGQTFKAWIQ